MRKIKEILMLNILILIVSVAIASQDAYIHSVGKLWKIGTQKVEKTLKFDEGKFFCVSLLDKISGFEYQRESSLEFEFATKDGNKISSVNGNWELIDSNHSTHSDGTLELTVSLKHCTLQLVVVKHYMVYPCTSVIREWLVFRNDSDSIVSVIEPSFFLISFDTNAPRKTDFYWMTGGESIPGSWNLQKEKLVSYRTFDSFEPFPISAVTAFPGNGVNIQIRHNDKRIWPEKEWHYMPHSALPVEYRFVIEVQKGDFVRFIVNSNGSDAADYTNWDPIITYADGQSHCYSNEYSDIQGKTNWYYQAGFSEKYVDLEYFNPRSRRWSNDPHSIEVYGQEASRPYIGADFLCPSNELNASLTWKAPKSGLITLSGFVRNTRNWVGSGRYEPRPGSSSYAPWYAFFDQSNKSGLFIGWDYFGHWRSILRQKERTASCTLYLAGFNRNLKSGETFTTPKGFVGFFQNDLDNAGNNLLDWQYRYLWKYTREEWFPAIRMLGDWWNSCGDPDSVYRVVLRIADLMRYCGADVYHRDSGWWSEPDYQGVDWKSVNQYLRKQDMGLLIYIIPYMPYSGCSILNKYPEYFTDPLPEWGTRLPDLSKPTIVDFFLVQFENYVKQWGDFQWRTDGFFTCPVNGDHTPLLEQDQGFRKLVTRFLDCNPGCAFQACNCGGNYAGYEYVGYATSIQMTDGGVGNLANYYLSLLLPPDKVCHMPDAWRICDYNKSWRSLLAFCFDMTGDTQNREQLEGVRLLIDIYHYLHKEGVVGRWSKVYRPRVEGDDPIYYFQRANANSDKAIVIIKHQPPGAIRLYPKGLITDMKYEVTFQEAADRFVRTGRELMQKGISLFNVSAGELIYFNMPLHPGSSFDKEPPNPPASVVKSRGVNMNQPGVEIRWEASKDNNWISYYEIYREEQIIDKVSKGTFYFDRSVGANSNVNYAVCAVDGAGNRSVRANAHMKGDCLSSVQIWDDTSNNLLYSGNWEISNNNTYAYQNTISRSNTKGDSVSFEFQGKRIYLFVQIGSNGGKAKVQIDQHPEEIIDTYAGDNIWNYCIFTREFKHCGPHKISVEVLGEKNFRSSDCYVAIDGFRSEID